MSARILVLPHKRPDQSVDEHAEEFARAVKAVAEGYMHQLPQSELRASLTVTESPSSKHE